MPRLVDDQLFGKEPNIVDPDLIEDGLRSKQFATILDLLGYGEIHGIDDPQGDGSSTFRKNIFLDGTPIQNNDGTENFTDVEVHLRNGTSDQTAVPDINGVENTIPVGVALTNSPFTTTKTGTYTLAGSGGQTVSGVTLGPNQMLVEIASHGYSVGEVIHWENTTATATVQTDNPQTQNILSIPDSGKFVVNTTFEDTSFQNGACEVKTSIGLSRSITNTSVDKVRVTMQFPALQEFKDDGDIIAAEAKISIRITENNGNIRNPVILDVTNGRATSPYLKDYEIEFNRVASYLVNAGTVKITLENHGFSQGDNLVLDFQEGGFNGLAGATTVSQVNNANEFLIVFNNPPVQFQSDAKVVISDQLQYPIVLSVIRNTADGTDPALQNSTNWLSYTEIQTDTSTYQGFAYAAIRFNAQEFQSYPKRMYRVKGTKVKIPDTNGGLTPIVVHDQAQATSLGLGTVDSFGFIHYPDGYVFNGTLKSVKEWTSDPAWILFDILTTDKGFGGTEGFITEDQLDVFSFYSASAYSSTLIFDKLTQTTEPRFSCNVVLNKKNDAYTLINDLCSVMNAMPFYGVGTLQLAQDRPTNLATNESEPQYIFNLSNVTEEGFTYQGAGNRTKFTAVEVSYFDNETQQIDFERVNMDSDTTDRLGFVRKTLKSFACTSRGQANRLGRWFLYSQLHEAEVVSFTTTLEAGVIVRPSTIIGIQDPVKAGVRKGGRIKTGVSTTQIVVDRMSIEGNDLSHESGSTLTVILPNGKASLPRTISSINGTTITVSSAFAYKDDDGNEVTATPQANSVYVIDSPSVKLQIFRVISIEEKNDCQYTITALFHAPDKYDFVENLEVPQARNITTILDTKPAPSNLTATEQIVELNNRAVSKIFVSWQPVQGVKEYLLGFKRDNENLKVVRISRPTFELFESELGTYKFFVKSYNALNKLSKNTSSLTFNAIGKTAVPADPSGLTVEPISDQFIRLRFNPSSDVDVIHGGTIEVRHTPNTGATATFGNATQIIPKLSGNITETLVPALTGTYLIKFIDDGGRKSTNAAKIIVTQPDPQPNQVILTEREDTDSPPFQGNKVNTFYDADFDGLLLDGTLLIDSITQNIDDLSNIDFAGPITSSGSYEFQNEIEMGGIFNLMLQRRFVTSGLLPNDLIDSRTANIDTWTEFDGTLAEDVNAKLLVATTQLDTATSTAATYEQSGTTITITKSGHGYSVGDQVVIDFTAGSAVDGNYEIQTITGSTFTVTASASATISAGTSCNYGPNFSQFNTFANGEYRARGFKFKCELESNDPAQNINVTELGYEASVKRRTETVNTAIASQCATNSSAKTVTFGSPFFAGTGSLGGSTTAFLPTVGITLEGAVSGDYFKITSITGTQFVIETRDSSNDFKDLSFKYTAIGFGKGT
jgi:predicted phage tail protein